MDRLNEHFSDFLSIHSIMTYGVFFNYVLGQILKQLNFVSDPCKPGRPASLRIFTVLSFGHYLAELLCQVINLKIVAKTLLLCTKTDR